MREKIIKIIQDSVQGCSRYWAELIADGLIAEGSTVPLANVGDTVYSIVYDKVEAFIVISIESKRTPGEVTNTYLSSNGDYPMTFNDECIGSSVFLSAQEAELSKSKQKE